MKKLPLLLLSILLLAACNGKQRRHQPAEDGKPVITVTIEPLRYFTEAIVGDRFQVVSMVPKGASPETYDPAPQQIIDLSHSQAYFRIGYIGFEHVWMDKLAENTPHLRFFDLSKGIDLIYDKTHVRQGGQEGGHASANTLPQGVEPHVWNSAINAQIIAGNILKALHLLDDGNDSLYRARYDSLCRRIERTDSLIRSILTAGNADTSFLIYHPALSYFARDYGLRQTAIEEGGKEPSPAHLQRLVELCRNENVHVAFVQPEFDRRNIELIARQTGTQIVDINPLAYDWEREMLHAARALQGKQPSTCQQ